MRTPSSSNSGWSSLGGNINPHNRHLRWRLAFRLRRWTTDIARASSATDKRPAVSADVRLGVPEGNFLGIGTKGSLVNPTVLRPDFIDSPKDQTVRSLTTRRSPSLPPSGERPDHFPWHVPSQIEEAPRDHGQRPKSRDASRANPISGGNEPLSLFSIYPVLPAGKGEMSSVSNVHAA